MFKILCNKIYICKMKLLRAYLIYLLTVVVVNKMCKEQQ